MNELSNPDALWREALTTPRHLYEEISSYQKKLEDYIAQGFKIDDNRLTSQIIGATCGMSLLGALLWHLHHEKLETGFTNALLNVVLAQGADPNIRLNGYTPAELFIISAVSRDMPGPSLCEITRTLVKKGMDANQVMRYPKVEDFIQNALKVKDGEYFRHLLFDGPHAVLLENSTQDVRRLAPRRTL